MQFIALGKATQLTLGSFSTTTMDSLKGCTPVSGFWENMC